MKRKQSDETPERYETDSEEVLRQIAESERDRNRGRDGPGIIESRWVGPRMYKREVYGK